jgi:hypothetical protein
MKTKHAILSAVLFGAVPALAGTSSPSFEQSIAPAAPASDWSVRLSLYGWAQGLDGDAGVFGRTVPVDIGFDDLVEDLDFAVMGAVEVGYGRWSFLADMVYADTGTDYLGPLGGTGHADLKQFLGNFLVTYEVLANDSIKFDLYGGARVNHIDLDLSYTGPVKKRNFSVSGDETWVDPVIGARFHAELGHSFFFRALGDVGGFGIESDITWQALAAFGYQFNSSCSALIGYRALGTDYKNDGFTYDVVASGPIIGLQYNF